LLVNNGFGSDDFSGIIRLLRGTLPR